ncbi:hypothetical protein GCM10007049_03730 [Echinicola pacifica]|uniref:Uncharacterized protein n=2 Tax=Echinicola pacifica TaxID=346377 RepID=A0A918PMK3_9BACT|nr:hypothetical protein GCM10007049_03730 [Echinicola pacifica]
MTAETNNQVLYYASRASIENIKGHLINQGKADLLERVVFKNTYVFTGKKTYYNYLIKIFIAALINTRIALFAKKDTYLIYNFNNIISLFPLNLVSKLFNKKILMCCHAELEALMIPSSKKRWNFRAQDSFFKNSKISESMNFLVFGDSILDNLSKILPEKKMLHFKAITHPYFLADVSLEDLSKENLGGKDAIKIGIAGILDQNKGLNNLLELVKLLKPTMDQGLVEIYTISRLKFDKKIVLDLGVKIYNTENKFYSRQEYLNAIHQMNYIYLPYDRDRYKLTASGAVFEGIFSKKPILALRNDYFDFLFNTYGNFGYLHETNEELASTIVNAANNKSQNDLFDLKFPEIKERLHPSFLAYDFNNIINTSYLAPNL